MATEVWVAIIGAIQAVLLVILNQRAGAKAEKRHEETVRGISRNSIENMIMWDEFNYHFNHKIPTNYEEVHDAYDEYHRNGGNGVMTRRVKEYDGWIDKLEKEKLGK